ncbi:MAG: M24 family metallopeptidase [Acidobacteriota bacterium]
MAALIIAASETDADLLYATGIQIPDPFIFFQMGRRRSIVLSDLEIGRGRRQARVDEVLSLSEVERCLSVAGRLPGSLAEVAAWLLRKRGVRAVHVPGSFAIQYAEVLRRRRIRVVPGGLPFYRERLLKSAAEVRAIVAALRIAERGMAAGIECLKNARPGRDGILRLGGERLSSERLRAVIDQAVLAAGGAPAGTIVAGGLQACDPHEAGHGALRADQAIILDVFPRAARSGYFGDITRTVVRGRASEALKRQWHAVAEGQRIGLRSLRAGVRGDRVHARIQAHFEACGYRTGWNGRRMEGFFHGTGHGLGLEIHEPPRINPAPQKLRSRNVVTVEPGLYYHATGGVRLEDVVVIGARGNRNLTRFPKFLEI